MLFVLRKATAMSFDTLFSHTADVVAVVFQVFVAFLVLGRIAFFVLSKVGMPNLARLIDRMVDRLLSAISY